MTSHSLTTMVSLTFYFQFMFINHKRDGKCEYIGTT